MLPEKPFQYKMDYKVLVSTWNVGGLQPSDGLDLEDLLQTKETCYDIYVLGFQEIVPLNAKNIIGPERRSISLRWNTVISEALNKKYGEKKKRSSCEEYECLICKQMVGIMVSVWVRRELQKHFHHLSVSCVACGFLGFLGNKGSVSVRFFLHGTSICFVCCHLASGGKEGDEVYRNSDAIDIISRTNFPHISSTNLPQKIFDHDRIILLGDLNYRISLPEAQTRSLVERKEWNLLLEKDQLRYERAEGRVFADWEEGKISFHPTYKYYPNTDKYYCSIQGKKEKARAPAWCDRILWYGKGLKQSEYKRCELKLSDHRPVRGIFTVEVVAPSQSPSSPALSTTNFSSLMRSFFSSDGFERLDGHFEA
ncbi:hypothetical protein M5K25_001281 [Dendrobium thyrsiflorum]|uniref:Inositol polyphosphate-related phosphatase domain-containing protein n=1 Tax=Dendrobium thyrsiflorum TaxID=117978 RepID=A0ABD0VPV9_DENTH